MEHELIILENQIAQAIVQGDTAFMDRVWDDEFFYTGVRGEVKTKKEVLAELRSGDLKFELLQFDDFRVRVYGETAMVIRPRHDQGAELIGGNHRPVPLHPSLCETPGAMAARRLSRHRHRRAVGFGGHPI
jgi:hypothetical protein